MCARWPLVSTGSSARGKPRTGGQGLPGARTCTACENPLQPSISSLPVISRSGGSRPRKTPGCCHARRPPSAHVPVPTLCPLGAATSPPEAGAEQRGALCGPLSWPPRLVVPLAGPHTYFLKRLLPPAEGHEFRGGGRLKTRSGRSGRVPAALRPRPGRAPREGGVGPGCSAPLVRAPGCRVRWPSSHPLPAGGRFSAAAPLTRGVAAGPCEGPRPGTGC